MHWSASLSIYKLILNAAYASYKIPIYSKLCVRNYSVNGFYFVISIVCKIFSSSVFRFTFFFFLFISSLLGRERKRERESYYKCIGFWFLTKAESIEVLSYLFSHLCYIHIHHLIWCLFIVFQATTQHIKTYLYCKVNEKWMSFIEWTGPKSTSNQSKVVFWIRFNRNSHYIWMRTKWKPFSNASILTTLFNTHYLLVWTFVLFFIFFPASFVSVL